MYTDVSAIGFIGMNLPFCFNKPTTTHYRASMGIMQL